MNGLDAILNRIISDAEDRAREIREQATTRVGHVLAEADQTSEKLLAEARQHAEAEAAVLLRRAQSTAALEARKHILAARQELIDAAIAQAGTHLGNLPPQEKSALYARLLSEHAGGEETVVFPRADQASAAVVIAAVNRDKGWRLTLAAEPGDFDTGVILRQGLIETNLTTEQLVRSMRPELVSLAAKTLFGT